MHSYQLVQLGNPALQHAGAAGQPSPRSTRVHHALSTLSTAVHLGRWRTLMHHAAGTTTPGPHGHLKQEVTERAGPAPGASIMIK